MNLHLFFMAYYVVNLAVDLALKETIVLIVPLCLVVNVVHVINLLTVTVNQGGKECSVLSVSTFSSSYFFSFFFSVTYYCKQSFNWKKTFIFLLISYSFLYLLHVLSTIWTLVMFYLSCLAYSLRCLYFI